MSVNSITPANGSALRAPVRNRYFYGKLLDVHHLEMEQRYFLEMERLMNRLTVGSGVLCGLHVQASGQDAVTVSPGVAVDGYGREIVVTESVTLDLASLLADRVAVAEPAAPAKPARGRKTPGAVEAAAGSHAGGVVKVPELGGTVLCLSYHECDVEPEPVLVMDCDVRESCTPGAVRERFMFTLMPASQAPFPEDPCSIMNGPSGASTAVRREWMLAQLRDVGIPAYGTSAGGGMRTGSGAASELRRRLCEAYQPDCAPGSPCVPVALLTRGATGVVVDECAPRRTIYSNAVLLDLILCLAAEVEQCCGRKVTVTAPKVAAASPAPGDSVAFAQLAKDAELAISFDRPMDAGRLAAPDDWLRLLFAVEYEATVSGNVQTQTVGLEAKLTYDAAKTTNTTLDGSAGQTAYYKIGAVSGGTGAGGAPGGTGLAASSLLRAFKGATLKAARGLVLIRSDDVTQIVAADDGGLLDADFAGTALTGELFDFLWYSAPLAELGFGGALLAALGALPSPAPAFPSGNGFEGGVLHYSFEITTS